LLALEKPALYPTIALNADGKVTTVLNDVVGHPAGGVVAPEGAVPDVGI
jgi:hypothetical protein